MNAVFGPVLSRRLGRSLGIDPLRSKRCNLSCVYCQLGRTKRVTNDRRCEVAAADIVSQAKEVLGRSPPGSIDWVTFIGSGETCLYADLGMLIREVKAMTAVPVAVITNGTLLYRPEVRRELQAADAVLPSLDAGSAKLFRRVARPHPDCTFDKLLNGLVAFRKDFSSKLWLEVMLLDGINDSSEALHDLARAARRVAPDEIHINVPSRPPAERWVEPPTDAALGRACAILGGVARVCPPTAGAVEAVAETDTVESVMSIITRHPMEQAELERCLPNDGAESIAHALAELEQSGRARAVLRGGTKYWRATQGAGSDG